MHGHRIYYPSPSSIWFRDNGVENVEQLRLDLEMGKGCINAIHPPQEMVFVPLGWLLAKLATDTTEARGAEGKDMVYYTD